jgi:hypothetical protein
VVAFITSIVVLLLMTAVVAYVGWRRPQDQRLTWGEAMVGSVWFFMMLVLMFGTIPDQWIRWADAGLGWTTDTFFYQHANNDYIGGVVRFDIHRQAVRDVVVVIIHVIFLVAIPPAVLAWQRRGPARSWGEPRPAEVPVSDFGRPLVRET